MERKEAIKEGKKAGTKKTGTLLNRSYKVLNRIKKHKRGNKREAEDRDKK